MALEVSPRKCSMPTFFAASEFAITCFITAKESLAHPAKESSWLTVDEEALQKAGVGGRVGG